MLLNYLLSLGWGFLHSFPFRFKYFLLLQKQRSYQCVKNNIVISEYLRPLGSLFQVCSIVCDLMITLQGTVTFQCGTKKSITDLFQINFASFCPFFSVIMWYFVAFNTPLQIKELNVPLFSVKDLLEIQNLLFYTFIAKIFQDLAYCKIIWRS